MLLYVWKIQSGIVKDYSIQRTKFGIVSTNYPPATQLYKGVLGVNDSLVLISSNSNANVIRINTGKNDSTASALPAVFGAYEPGVYTLVANASVGFPATFYLSATHHIRKLNDGKVVMSNGSQLAITADYGTTWSITKPPVPHAWWNIRALDVTPNGRIVIGGSAGIMYDSLPGSPSWRTQYKNLRPYTYSDVNPLGYNTFFDFSGIDFADCDNGIILGNSGTFIKTSDGGKTWVNNSNNVLEGSNISTFNAQYRSVNNLYFTGADNKVYHTPDQGNTYTTIFKDPLNSAISANCFTTASESRAFLVAFRSAANPQRTVIFQRRGLGQGIEAVLSIQSANNGPRQQCEMVAFNIIDSPKALSQT